MMKRRFTAFVSILLFSMLLLIPVSANAPPSAELEGVSAMTPFTYLLFIGIVGGSICITCLSEWLVGLPFGLSKDHWRLILLTNLVSQLLMWLVTFVVAALPGDAYSSLYIAFVVIIELLIYAGEFLIYRRKMKTVSFKRILCYTVCANTVSLLIGVLVYNPMISL